jgi:NADH-quinone oxidoreductase subunit K
MTGDVALYLAIGAGLYALGAIGFLARRNTILMILSAELMLHGVSLTLVTFGHMHATHEGQAFTIFVLTVAACDAGLALSLFLALYQKTRSLDIDVWTELREPDVPSPRRETGPPVSAEPLREFPRLSPAGRPPDLNGDLQETFDSQHSGDRELTLTGHRDE